MNKSQHPVWHVYDELRTARLNVYYYGARLARARRWQTARELVMAASGSTGVAGIWLFSTASGAAVWKLLASVSALLAVFHTVTRPTETIRRLERQVTAWGQLELSLADLRRRIHEAGRYDETLQKEAKVVLEQKRSIVTELVDTDVDTRLRDRCFAQVKQELPVTDFFVPETTNQQLPGSANVD